MSSLLKLLLGFATLSFSSLMLILLILLLVPLVSMDAVAQTKAIPFVHEKTHVLPSGKTVAVKFRERLCKSGKSSECSEAGAGMWGMDGGIPWFVTEVFQVAIDGKEFLIPEKFYKDLTNTYRVNVLEQKARIVIELQGGEAAGAYTARFTLGGMCGFERKICGEVCKEIWERTVWYNSFAYEADPQCESGIE